jgi:hypothetical protein
VRIDWLRQFSVTIQSAKATLGAKAARIASELPWCFPATIWEGQPKGSGWKIPVVAGFEWCRLSASLGLADSNRLISFASESGPNPRVQHYRRGLG